MHNIFTSAKFKSKSNIYWRMHNYKEQTKTDATTIRVIKKSLDLQPMDIDWYRRTNEG